MIGEKGEMTPQTLRPCKRDRNYARRSKVVADPPGSDAVMPERKQGRSQTQDRKFNAKVRSTSAVDRAYAVARLVAKVISPGRDGRTKQVDANLRRQRNFVRTGRNGSYQVRDSGQGLGGSLMVAVSYSKNTDRGW
jgi:hypothetical protein